MVGDILLPLHSVLAHYRDAGGPEPPANRIGIATFQSIATHPFWCPKIPDFAAQDGLGQQTRCVGLTDFECPGNVLNEHHAAVAADEREGVVPAAGCRYVIVGQGDGSLEPQVIAEFDHAIPQRNPVRTLKATFPTQRDAFLQNFVPTCRCCSKTSAPAATVNIPSGPVWKALAEGCRSGIEPAAAVIAVDLKQTA